MRLIWNISKEMGKIKDIENRCNVHLHNSFTRFTQIV
uniref:Uncharacterized protein n=1 Tax=Rhizophora mucronata TaxID=61149 RepID=A0A2P2NY61_RHIMU